MVAAIILGGHTVRAWQRMRFFVLCSDHDGRCVFITAGPVTYRIFSIPFFVTESKFGSAHLLSVIHALDSVACSVSTLGT